MKLRIWSDLHNEFSLFLPKGEYKDEVLILAGDIALSYDENMFDYVIEHYTNMFQEVVMVAGNHEAYNYSIEESNAFLTSLDDKFSNFHFLNDDIYILDDVVFIGSTYWTHILKHAEIMRGLNDFHVIKDFSTYRCNEYNRKAYKFIKDACSFFRCTEKKRVVITHHAPSYKSLHPQYAGSDINEAFMNDDDELVELSGAALWVHGHSHSVADYMIDNTQVICNPRGYRTPRTYEDTGFNDKLIIEV